LKEVTTRISQTLFWRRLSKQRGRNCGLHLRSLSFEVLSEDPGKRLEMMFEPHFFGPDAPHSRCVYEIEEAGNACKLTITHFDIQEGQEGVAQGWSLMAASLKSFLEIGEGIKGVSMS